jgi:leucine dehydrogenase
MQITEIPITAYEKVVRCQDKDSGLLAFIAVHDTTLGPALGGLRMWPYQDERAAMFDVLRLARGMTYKSAVADTGLGGGKSVIVGDPRKLKSEALYLAMGRFIDSLGGSYITAEDVNTGMADLEIIRRSTRHVTGLDRSAGGSGNPSSYTALGCYLGIIECLKRAFDSEALTGRVVSLQGIGAVGGALARRLVEGGAKVFAADINEERLQQLAREIGVVPIPEKEALEMKCDVLSPNALGAGFTDQTIPKLNCRIVAGAANNQLLEPRHGEDLRRRGILYAPDYVINAGGIINVGCELLPGGYDEQKSLEKIRRIPAALREVFDMADEKRISTNKAADQRAEQILMEARRKAEK